RLRCRRQTGHQRSRPRPADRDCRVIRNSAPTGTRKPAPCLNPPAFLYETLIRSGELRMRIDDLAQELAGRLLRLVRVFRLRLAAGDAIPPPVEDRNPVAFHAEGSVVILSVPGDAERGGSAVVTHFRSPFTIQGSV